MFTFLLATSVIILVILVIVSAMRPSRSDVSRFELERRVEKGDRAAKRLIHREDLLNDVVSLQYIIVTLLLVVISILSVMTFGLFWGIVVAILVALEYGVLARAPIIKRQAQRFYSHLEPALLRFVKKSVYVLRLFRTERLGVETPPTKLSSRQELQHLVSQSDDVLTTDEKQLVVHGLGFSDQLISSVMTLHSVVDTISKTEFLGPLTLDALHKLGHSRLPVINGDIDHVIGILHLHDLLKLDIKRSVTAEKAMEARVFYIRQDQTLQHALAAFLRTHHHLFIVVDQQRKTVGLLTLQDVIEALLGRKIVDEFDDHDDLKTVAVRNINSHNNSNKHRDI
jgi:CBS domain containing-hemolysin-like protein